MSRPLVTLQVVRVGLGSAETMQIPMFRDPTGPQPTAPDRLHRNSFLLMLNYAIVGGIGFFFWVVAARLFPAAEIGRVASLFSGLSFLGVAAGLGLQNTVVRYLATEKDQRIFLLDAFSLVATLSALLVTGVVLIPGHLGMPLVGEASAPGTASVIAIAVFLAVGAIADAAIIGFRATGVIVIKNAIAGSLRLAALPLVAGWGEVGLLLSLLGSVMLATMVSLVICIRRSRWAARSRWTPSFAALTGKVQFSAGNHVATLLSVGPLFLLPVFVVNVLGPSAAAYFAACVNIMIALNALPSTVSQSLFAELAARPDDTTRLVSKAFRTAYFLVAPAVAIVVVVAPWVLGLFGTEYTSATTCLRLLALGALFGAYNYLGDVVLNASGRIVAFTVVNVAGALTVMGASIGLGFQGLTGLGIGWLVGQMSYSGYVTVALRRSKLIGVVRARALPATT